MLDLLVYAALSAFVMCVPIMICARCPQKEKEEIDMNDPDLNEFGKGLADI